MDAAHEGDDLRFKLGKAPRRPFSVHILLQVAVELLVGVEFRE